MPAGFEGLVDAVDTSRDSAEARFKHTCTIIDINLIVRFVARHANRWIEWCSIFAMGMH